MRKTLAEEQEEEEVWKDGPAFLSDLSAAIEDHRLWQRECLSRWENKHGQHKATNRAYRLCGWSAVVINCASKASRWPSEMGSTG